MAFRMCAHIEDNLRVFTAWLKRDSALTRSVTDKAAKALLKWRLLRSTAGSMGPPCAKSRPMAGPARLLRVLCVPTPSSLMLGPHSCDPSCAALFQSGVLDVYCRMAPCAMDVIKLWCWCIQVCIPFLGQNRLPAGLSHEPPHASNLMSWHTTESHPAIISS